MLNIYFWRSAIGNQALLDEHQDTIKRLLSGDYAKADLEKLKGHNIYSFRLNSKARLLFTEHVVADKKYILILEHLPNHEYESSRFLKKAVLAHYREREAETLADDVQAMEKSFAPVPDGVNIFASSPQSVTSLNAIPLDYFNEQFIELSAIQAQAREVSLPLVLSGIAGSGKSCTLLSLAIEQALSLMKPVLYVAQSKILLNEIEKNWLQHLCYNDNPHLLVFKTYDELFNRQNLAPRPSSEACTASVAVDNLNDMEKIFSDWYQLYLEHERKVIETRSSATSAPIDNTQPLTTARRELRICSGYTCAEYIAVGQKKSALNENQRAWIYKTYKMYLDYLEQNELTDSALQAPVERPTRYARVFVDEAHDFSQLQLEVLLQLAEHQAIVYCLDSHQMLYDAISTRAHLMQRLYQKLHYQPTHIELPVSYRCPVNIARAVDMIIGWKQSVLGLADKFEAKSITPSTEITKALGQFYFINRDNPQFELNLKERAQNISFAVVTTHENRKAAATWLKKQDIKASLIFTPEEIKGLQYETVLVFEMCSDKSVFERIKLSAPMVDQEQAIHRYKKGKGEVYLECDDAQFINVINGLIVACTRATDTLLICNDQTHFNRSSIESLRRVCTEYSGSSTSMPVKVSTSADYLKEAIKLYERKLVGQSENLYKNYLNEEDRAAYLQWTSRPKVSQSMQQRAISQVIDHTNTTNTASRVDSSEAILSKTVLAKSSVSSSGVSIKIPQKSQRERSSLEKAFPTFTYEKLKHYWINGPKTMRLHFLIVESKDNLSYILNNEGRTNELILLLSKLGSFRANILASTTFFDQLLNIEMTTSQGKQVEKIVLAILDFHPELLLSGAYKICSKSGNIVEYIQKFKEQVKDLNKKNTISGCSLLHYAAFNNDTAGLKTLKKFGADLNQYTNDGRATAAYLAAEFGYEDFIQVLHDFGAEINKPVTNGVTPAFVATKQGHIGVIEKLFKLGYLQNQRLTDNSTPAHYAAQYGRVEVLRALKRLGEDINQARIDGATPAFLAVQHGQGRVLEILPELGVSLNQPIPGTGASLAHFAVMHQQLGIIKTLKQLDQNLSPVMNDGVTPAVYALKYGMMNVLKVLHQLGVNLNEGLEHGETIAHIAAEYGHLKILNLLFELGIDVNQADDRGLTPAIIAGNFEQGAVLEFFVDRGLIPKPLNAGDSEAFRIAAKRQYSQAVALQQLAAVVNRNPDSIRRVIDRERDTFFVSEELNLLDNPEADSHQARSMGFQYGFE